MIEFAYAQPIAATFMFLFAVCAAVGLVDRLTEPWRLRAKARADYARAEMLREVDAAARRQIAELNPPISLTPPPAPERMRPKWTGGKGS